MNNEEYEIVNFNEQPFIVHYRGRSEIEYSMRCVQSWPGLPVALYPNRQGFRVPSAPLAMQNTYVSLVQNAVPEEYFVQLDIFLADCEVLNLIDESRKAVNESTLLNVLEKIDDEVLVKEEQIWRRTFSNTKFIDYFERRLSSLNP